MYRIKAEKSGKNREIVDKLLFETEKNMAECTRKAERKMELLDKKNKKSNIYKGNRKNMIE